MKYQTIRESLKFTGERIKNVIKLSNRSIKRIFDLTQIETILDLCFNVLERDDRGPLPGGQLTKGFEAKFSRDFSIEALSSLSIGTVFVYARISRAEVITTLQGQSGVQLTRPLTGGEDPSKKSGIDPRPKIAPPKILNLSIPRYFILDGGGA